MDIEKPGWRPPCSPQSREIETRRIHVEGVRMGGRRGALPRVHSEIAKSRWQVPQGRSLVIIETLLLRSIRIGEGCRERINPFWVYCFMPVVGQCFSLRSQLCLPEIHPAVDRLSEPSAEWNDESGGGGGRKGFSICSGASIPSGRRTGGSLKNGWVRPDNTRLRLRVRLRVRLNQIQNARKSLKVAGLRGL
jgi:hypothetical protein